MKANVLAPLLISTFLSSAVAYAVGDLSDAYNGIIPEDIKKSPERLKGWQESTAKKFTERANIAGLAYDQAERFFAPMTRRGDKQTHKQICALANAVCDFLEQRADKKTYMKEIFDGHQGVNTEVKTASQFQDGGLPSTGHHVPMIRQIQAHTKGIQDLDEKIKAYPGQKHTWEEEIKNKKGEIKTYEKSLQEVKQKKENNRIDGVKAEREVIDTERQIKETQSSIARITEGLEKEENELKTLKEKIEKIKNPQTETEEKSDTPLESGLDALQKQYEHRETQLKGLKFQETKRLEEKQKELENINKTLEEQKTKQREIELILATLDAQETEFSQKIEELNDGIRKLTETIQFQESEIKSLSAKREQKEKQRREHQDQADAYALVKYLSYLNVYSALPNDDFDYHKFKEQGYELSTLSPFVLPLTVGLVNKRASTVGDYNAHQVTKREIGQYTRSNANTLEETLAFDAHSPLPAALNKVLKDSTYGASDMGLAVKGILNAVGRHITSQNLFSAYNKARPEPERYDFFSLRSQPLNLEEALKEFGDTLTSQRVDRVMRVALDKWRSKISVGEDSLVHRLGLDGTLFHKDYPITSHPHILSLQEFLKGLPEKKDSESENLWSYGLMQIKTNYFDIMSKGPTSSQQRIMPIYDFVEKKASQSQKKEKKEQGFEEKLKKSLQKEEKDTLLRKAFLKMISYLNMLHALQYDEKGKKLPEIKSVDPILEKLINKPIPRLDQMFADKALKWSKRVYAHGQEFIEAYGLKAHIFKIDNLMKEKWKFENNDEDSLAPSSSADRSERDNK